jgi:hypothetical protein
MSKITASYDFMSLDNGWMKSQIVTDSAYHIIFCCRFEHMVDLIRYQGTRFFDENVLAGFDEFYRASIKIGRFYSNYGRIESICMRCPLRSADGSGVTP